MVMCNTFVRLRTHPSTCCGIHGCLNVCKHAHAHTSVSTAVPAEIIMREQLMAGEMLGSIAHTLPTSFNPAHVG